MNSRRNKIEVLWGHFGHADHATLLLGPAHGYQIAKHFQQSDEDVLRLNTVSLSAFAPAQRGGLASKCETRDGKREFKYYRLTATARKQLAAEESGWEQLVRAIARVATPVVEVVK